MIGTKEYQKRFGGTTKAEPKNANAKRSRRVTATFLELDASIIALRYNAFFKQYEMSLSNQ